MMITTGRPVNKVCSVSVCGVPQVNCVPAAVSALTKISSVRIVPTPTATPTPSVCGGSEASNTIRGIINISGLRSLTNSNNNSVRVPQQLQVSCGGPSTVLTRPHSVVRPSLNSLATSPRVSSSVVAENQRLNLPLENNNSILPDVSRSPQGTDQRTSTDVTPDTPQGTSQPQSPLGPDDRTRRGDRERRRERRERRRERRALRIGGTTVLTPNVNGQTEIMGGDVHHHPGGPPIHDNRLPDILNSHVPPPYSTLPSGPGAPRLIGHNGSPPHPIPLHMHPPPPGAPIPPGYPPPRPGSPHRPTPDNPWSFFGTRRSRGSPRVPPYLGDDEAKSCCGLLVTQAMSIRWFIIMIALVGLCCTVVGTILGAVKTNSSEYVTITLLMIGVGIVLITVSGVAWHLTSRDAPCRVMLGLAPNTDSREPRRFMARMAPAFGRPHHPYAAMLYPEFQYRPPPPSYQASMQEYRLRLLLLDRHSVHHPPPPPLAHHQVLPSPPPTYRSGGQRQLGMNPLSRESEYSRPPSYRSRDGSISQHPAASPLPPPAHSRDPSYVSFLSHESIYSTTSPPSQDGSGHRRQGGSKVAVVGEGEGVEEIVLPNSKKGTHRSRDDNTVTIVQTTDSSHVIGSESVIVTVSGSDVHPLPSIHLPHQHTSDTEISVLAHL